MSNVGIPVDTANFWRQGAPLLSPHAAARSLHAAPHDADGKDNKHPATSVALVYGYLHADCSQLLLGARPLNMCSRPFLATAQ